MSDIEKKIADNMGLVYKQLHKFNLAYNEEAVSYATEALWKAIETFDDSRDNAFSTYASACIYNGIMMYFRVTEKQSRIDAVSFEAELNEDGVTLEDLLVGAEDIEVSKLGIIYQAINNVMCSYKPGRQQDIIQLWVRSNFEATQQIIAEEFNTSQANVSRVLSTFKNKLKKELEVLL